MRANEHDEILFLSGIYPESLYNELTNRDLNKNVQIAADVLQKHIINGLDASLPVPVKLVNAPYVGVFPRSCKIARFKKSSFSHYNGSSDVNVSFINVPLIRHVSIYHSSKSEIKRWVKSHPNGVVMAYALTLRNVWNLLYAKKMSNSIITCMIVPHLPMYMRLSAGIIYRIAKRIENFVIHRKLHRIDSFVLLTEHMNDVIKSRNYCVVEGVATECGEENEEADSVKIVMYSGTLDKKYGISNLLQAFHQIKDDTVRLYICGTGDAQIEVEEMATQDERICFFGLVPREKVIQLQRQASVLVNPRQNVEKFTKYSFPSKNMEFLASGVPVIAYKLDGIPDEYDSYMHYVGDNSVQALKCSIEQVLSASPQERRSYGEKARHFVLENKNEIVQAKKILDLLERI